MFPGTTALLAMVLRQINSKAAQGSLRDLQGLRYKHPQLRVEEWKGRMSDSPAKTGVCQVKSFQESMEGSNLSSRHGN